MTAVLLFLAGKWRYLAAAVLLAGAYGWVTSQAYRRGVAHAEAACQAAAARAAADTAARAAANAAQAAGADAARAHRSAAYARRRAPIAQEVIRYVQTPAAAARCPDLRGVQLGQAAIDAANAAAAAR